MRRIGFSTGAIARGDFHTAVRLLAAHQIPVVELSALRLGELEPLIAAIADVDLSRFSFISFHAPSKFHSADEAYVLDCLTQLLPLKIPIVVHPDVMYTESRWAAFGTTLLIENMDIRKTVGRTAKELASLFGHFPDAGLCFDIGHARQVDPSMTEAYRILTQHGTRLQEVHMSEVDTGSHHRPISEYAVRAFQRVAEFIPPSVPIVLETLIDEGQSDLSTEIKKARRALLSFERSLVHSKGDLYISWEANYNLHATQCVTSLDRTDELREEQARVASNDPLFVERRPEGDYAVRRPNSERASAVLSTQAEAIAKALELSPGKEPLVERVRLTSEGSLDNAGNARNPGRLFRLQRTH